MSILFNLKILMSSSLYYTSSGACFKKKVYKISHISTQRKGYQYASTCTLGSDRERDFEGTIPI